MANKNQHEAVALSRDMSLFTITMIGVGGMIGAGIFVLTGIAAGVAGPALVLAFLLNGAITLLTAFSYAELGSAYPEAGGGYLWVKEGLGGANGFLAGWMSWFAHVAAGSLYALGFGRFSSEMWHIANMPHFGLSTNQLTLVFMTMIVMAFTYINVRGASETGSIGNVVTMAKVLILGLFVVFGVIAMLRVDIWHLRFTTGFLPNGFLGVFTAMGLTFIAFEGYEIIAQSGEEAVDPKRNIPRAIFIAIGIAVLIYVFVGITVIGATNPPEGMRAFEYLGEKKEIAVVQVAQQIFPWGIGGMVLLFSGLVSTMSALNATTYSSSRVSFAMGRDHNLPKIFAHINPQRMTPYWAVIISGVFMLLISWMLPIEDVAAAAGIMFLVLFLQVNVTVMALRKKLPELERGFKVPFSPVIPILAIILNGMIAIHLFEYSPIAWFLALGWIIGGLLLYYAHFSKVEALEKPKEILQEEVLVSRDYSVVVPVGDEEQGRILGRIGGFIARDNQGEVLALHVIKVPSQLSIGEGRLMLREGRPYLERVIEEAKKLNVPVHTVLRLGRKPAEAVRKTIEENAADLLLLGWPGYTKSLDKKYGSIIDPLIDNPPTDIALVRYRQFRPLTNVLVPVGGGVNSRRALRLAISMARQCESDTESTLVTLLHITPQGSGEHGKARSDQVFRDMLTGIDYPFIHTISVEGEDIAASILEAARGSQEQPSADLIVVGATNEPLFKNLLVGNVIDKIVREADVTVIAVKRRSSPLHSFIRTTVLAESNSTE